MTTAAEKLIKLYKGKSCLVRQHKILTDKIESLQLKLERVTEDLHLASSVSLIYKGHPMGGGTNGWCSRVPTLYGKFRRAEIYLNAHNRTTWGIKLYTGLGFHDDVFLGLGYPSREIAEHIALEFCLTGEILPQKDRKY